MRLAGSMSITCGNVVIYYKVQLRSYDLLLAVIKLHHMLASPCLGH